MPRIQINHPADIVISDQDPSADRPIYARRGAAGCAQEPAVHVGWHPQPDGDGWVQVHFEADLDYFKFIIDNPDGETLGRVRTTGYSPVLDRAQINLLIKTLRRARDAAYGRDE